MGASMTFDERTGLETLSEDECWALLESHHLGRLATVIAGQPEIFPVNYHAEDRSIIFQTAAGTKMASAVLGVGVAFEIDHADALYHEGWSVVLKGDAYEIEAMEERLAAEALPLQPWAPANKDRYVRIVPVEVTGRRLSQG